MCLCVEFDTESEIEDSLKEVEKLKNTAKIRKAEGPFRWCSVGLVRAECTEETESIF